MANGIESSCTDIVTEDHGFRVILEGLENTMTAKFRKNSLWSGKSCIFRVPEVLRRHKPEAYRPDVVSIGPFHRGGKKFRPIEEVKQWYLHNLLSRMNISLKTLMEGIDNIIEFEKRAREFYSEPPHLSRDDFIEMLILDGCFIVELFWKYFCWSFMHFLKTDLVPAEELNIDNDPIINKDCMIQYIYHDLLLLENQLPWFVLECLYNLTLDKYFPFPLKRIVLASFCKQESLSCMLQFYLSHRQDDDDHDYDAVSGDADDFDGEILHILDLVRTATTFRFKNKPIPGSKVKLSPATTLSESGIKFRKSTDSGIMEINFEDGVLTIPHLSIEELTEPLLRNLIAFEQCCPGRSHKVTAYAILINSLIASSKDMDFLGTKDIIGNRFSSENASQLFNKLCDNTTLNSCYYGELCTKVIEYNNVSWNRWLENLKRDYLSNPWKITSLVAAFTLLALTLLQTAFTIQQYYHSPRQ